MLHIAIRSNIPVYIFIITVNCMLEQLINNNKAVKIMFDTIVIKIFRAERCYYRCMLIAI